MGQSTAQKVLGNKRKRGDSTSGLVESSDSVSFNEFFCIRAVIDLHFAESPDPNKFFHETCVSCAGFGECEDSFLERRYTT